MNRQPYPKNNELGTLKTSYKNNPAHARDLLGFIALFILAGVFVLFIGFMQVNLRDQIPIFIGGGLLLAVGLKLYVDFRRRLNVSAAVYEDGFVFTDRRKRQILCRWDEVTEVYETLTYYGRRSHSPRWYRYTVHRKEDRPIKLDNAIMQPKKLGSVIQDKVDGRLLPQAIESYKTGETVMFGPQVGLNQQGVVSGQKLLPWEQVAEIKYSQLGNLEINQRDQRRAWKVIPHQKIANYPTLKAMMRHAIELNPSSTPPVIRDPKQPIPSAQPAAGISPSSIGGMSTRLGCDVRDLMMEGYTLDEIQGVLQGEYSLQELRQRKPGKARKRR